MADYTAIASVGKSLEQLLSTCFVDPRCAVPVPGHTTTAVLVQPEDLSESKGKRVARPCLSILLYGINLSADQGDQPRAATGEGPAHLALDLHYLLTPWATDAESEHRIVGRAMQCLASTPVLSDTLLTRSGGWGADETVSIVAEDLPTDSVARIFDVLPTGFRLSLAYCARISQLQLSPEAR